MKTILKAARIIIALCLVPVAIVVASWADYRGHRRARWRYTNDPKPSFWRSLRGNV